MAHIPFEKNILFQLFNFNYLRLEKKNSNLNVPASLFYLFFIFKKVAEFLNLEIIPYHGYEISSTKWCGYKYSFSLFWNNAM